MWSVTSYSELYRDGHAAERWNMLHPGETPRIPYVTRCLAQAPGDPDVADPRVHGLEGNDEEQSEPQLQAEPAGAAGTPAPRFQQGEAGEEREGEPRVLHRQQRAEAPARRQLARRFTAGASPHEHRLGRERGPCPRGERGDVRQPERGVDR